MLHFLTSRKTRHKTAAELEVSRIAKFHALMNAKLLGNIILVIYILITTVLSIDSYPPLYILAAHNLFPLFLQQVIRQRQEEKPLILPLFAQKYKYTSTKYHSNAMSFLCSCFFLFLWQQSELKNITNHSLLSLIPTLILFIIVVYRFVGILYYSKKFDHILTYGSIDTR